VSNSGDAEAKDVVITDQIPSGMTFASANENGFSSGSSVTWNVGTIAPGSSKSVSVTLNGIAPGTMRNTATARAYCCGEATASAEVSFKGVAAVLLEMVDTPDPIEVGNQTVYTIDVTNQGYADDHNIRIKCTLPDEEKYISADSSGAKNVQFSVSGQVVTFEPVPVIAPKERIQYRVTVQALRVGNVRFAVEMRTDESNSGGPINETESTNIY